MKQVLSESSYQYVFYSGLYSPADSIVILTASSIQDALFDRSFASFVEFYNSYCGACQRFAPTWKAVAKNVSSWTGIVQIAAMDCASDENNDVCRQFEVMRYPTMRYFPPNYSKGKKQLGTNLDHLLVPQIEELIDELTTHLVNETNGSADWPQFEKFEGLHWKELFDGAALDTKYVYIVNSELPGFLSQQALLDNVGVAHTAMKIVDGNSPLVKVSKLCRA